MLRKLDAMFELSENAANWVHLASNVVLVLGAVLALVGIIVAFWSVGMVGAVLALAGTIGVFWSGRSREGFANARASEAELKLEQLRRQVAPRQIQREVF